MRKIIYVLTVVMLASVVLSSCLSSEDEDTTLYDDMAITSFTMGTLNRYTTTTSSSTGNDTTIKTTLTGSLYPMTIDHVGCRIYNQTALPKGTDIKHVTCTLTTRNNGVVYIKNVDSDTLTYLYSTDSIDFSQPRICRVFATDGSGSRDYTVTVNVDDEVGTTFGWTLAGNTADTVGFASRQLAATADSVTLISREAEPDWQNEQKDDADSLLPQTGTTIVIGWDYTPVDDARYLLAVGSPQQEDEAYARVWRKISFADGSGQWVFMPWDDNNRSRLPRSDWYAMAYYDDTVLALTSDMTLRQSRDQGISWRENDTYALPDNLTGTRLSMAVDTKGRLWLVTNTGQVWKGELK